jgi:hypothetical protein
VSFTSKVSDVALDCGKLAFGLALASDIFKGTDGEISFLLASGITGLLFLIGFVFFFISKRGGKND